MDPHNHSVAHRVQYGRHHVRFLVDNKWRLRYDLETEENEAGELCNVVDVDASESFHVFSNTSWPTATLRARMVDDGGAALTEVRAWGAVCRDLCGSSLRQLARGCERCGCRLAAALRLRSI